MKQNETNQNKIKQGKIKFYENVEMLFYKQKTIKTRKNKAKNMKETKII